MATPPSVERFYDDAHLGNLFRVRGLYYDDFGHKGVDFVHAARTPVPSWCSGRVVVSTFYRALGETVIVDRGSGAGLDRFAGYCHLTTGSRIERGEYVNVGDVVGTVGSTGTSSSGPHLHATLEPAVTIGTRNARDPLPLIRKAVASLAPAGGGGTPIEPEQKDDDMKLIRTPDGTVSLVTCNGVAPITSAVHLTTLAKVLNADGGNWGALTADEADVVRSYVAKAAGTPTSGAPANLDAIVAELRKLPAATVAALKAAL